MRIAVIFFLLAITPLVDAQDYNALSGEYSIAGKTLIDPPDDEAHDSHMRFALTGAAARDLYRAMKVVARADICEPKKLIKVIGGMQCTSAAGGKTFECDFAIDIANQRIEGAVAC
jgi:hypothetical protein